MTAHILTRKTRLRPRNFLINDANGLLQQYRPKGDQVRRNKVAPIRSSRRRFRLFAFCVEQRPYPRRKLILGNWLLNQFDIGVEATLMDYGVARIAGHKQNLEAGAKALCLLRQLPPVHARQHHIGQQQINPRVPLLKEFERGNGIVSTQNPVIKVMKRLDQIGANIFVVLDNKDRFPMLTWHPLCQIVLRLRCGIDDQTWKVNLDRRALTELAVDFDVSARLFDESIDLAQPETGPPPIGLVEKNVSNARFITSWVIPAPLSVTAISTYCPRCTSGLTRQ